MNTGVLYGLLAGFICTAFLSLLYFIDFQNILTGYEKLSWFVILVFLFLGLNRERSLKEDKFLAFNDALKVSYQIFTLAYVVKFIFIYSLFNFYDTKLLEIARETAIKIFIEHKNQDIPEEIFEQQVTEFGKGYFGPRFFDIGIMLELVAGFILSLIAAYIMKREKPDY
jgi:hypothetical protein